MKLDKFKDNLRENIVFIFIFSLSLFYSAVRHETFISFIFIFFCLLGLFLSYKKVIHKILTVKTQKVVATLLLILLALTYLVFSYYNSRLTSFDGLALYLKNTILLTYKLNLGYTEVLTMPYLAELMLALIWRFSNLRIVNLTFGLIFLLSVFFTWLLIKDLKVSKFVKVFSFTIFIATPTLISFALWEFKTDLFLYCFAVILIYLFIKYLDTGKAAYLIFIVPLAVICILIKVSFIFPAAILFLLLFFEGEKSLKTFSKKIVTIVLLFLIPLAVWVLFFGIYIPVANITFGPFVFSKNENHISLDRNLQKYKFCENEVLSKDKNMFIYGETIVERILQPVFYIIRYKTDPVFAYGFANPSLFIYLGILLFIFLPLLKARYKEFYSQRSTKYLFVFCIINLVFFAIYIRTLYWYLFYLYPFFAISIALFVEHFVKSSFKRIVLLILILSLGLTTLSVNLLGIFDTNLSKEIGPDMKNEILNRNYFFDTMLNDYANDGLILNASEMNLYVLNTFLKDADTRVVYSRYYFYSSNKTTEEMYNELKQKNIKYIVVSRRVLFDEWYTGCARQNNEILSDFLNKYTYPVYSMSISPVLFLIK